MTDKKKLQIIPHTDKILQLLNTGCRVQLEYNPKTETVYLSKIHREKIKIGE